MYFVSSQSEAEQINDIVDFMAENMNDSVTLDKTSPAFADFPVKVTKYAQTKDYKGLLEYLLTLKQEILSLPISHKN